MQRLIVTLTALMLIGCGGMQPDVSSKTSELRMADDMFQLLNAHQLTSDLTRVREPLQAEYIGPLSGNPEEGLFHVQTCPAYTCMQCIESFSSIEAAIEAGFEPHDCAMELYKAFVE